MKITEIDKNKWIYAIMEGSPVPLIIKLIDIRDDLGFFYDYEENRTESTRKIIRIWSVRAMKAFEWKYLPEVIAEDTKI